MPKKPKIKEKDLQKQILDYLRMKNIFCYKNNTSGIYKQSTGSYIPSQNVGAPDIIAIIAGQYIGIECKVNGCMQTEAQKEYQENVEKAGGIYILARELDDVANWPF